MSAREFDNQIASLRSTLKAFTRRFTTDRDESNDFGSGHYPESPYLPRQIQGQHQFKGLAFHHHAQYVY